ncbi:enoyl-CoA hydratase-related protein [Nitrospirillum iridis]|uniref:Enoyl-CoA hydratase/carnithine racemase n=1 Tax=Nitrospirillum iridis TaxID=765888 RepID=A0A7X0AWE7_9PROT|nr:enoyl-CoA hydratase-related protein [Nitrospirillum iridis]MBB6251333.1 enoyl-CoA hydratase/carnithine racemase [Nitrospirillum iridis]
MTDTFSPLHLRLEDDGIAVATLEAPGRANLLDDALIAALDELAEVLETREEVRGLIITSAKGHFLLGREPLGLLALADAAPGLSDDALLAAIAPYGDALRRLEGTAKPIAAALTGSALGPGLELALACGYRVACDHPAARFGFPDQRLGLMPMAGGTQRLPRLLGWVGAHDLLSGGHMVTAAAALELKLVNEVVPASHVRSAALAWVRRHLADGKEPPFIVAHKRKPVAVISSTMAIETAVGQGLALSLDEGLGLERAVAAGLLRRGEVAALVRTLVVAKGAADKAAWRPALPTAELARVAVLGRGPMADSVALAARRAGLDVHAVADAEGLDELAPALLGERKIEILFDATREDLAAKHALLARAEAVLGDDALLALTGPRLSVAAVGRGLSWPDRLVGLSLPPDGGVAEIVAGPKTSAPALAIAVDAARRLGRTPFKVGDGEGRYLARLTAAYLRAALELGPLVAPADTDAAARAAGLAEGPWALARRLGYAAVTDLVGEDGAGAVLATLKRPATESVPLDPPQADAGPRLLAAVRTAVVQALAEGLVNETASADLMAVLGFGWPAASGGPLGSFARR